MLLKPIALLKYEQVLQDIEMTVHTRIITALPFCYLVEK
jgi:hypothetical protein